MVLLVSIELECLEAQQLRWSPETLNRHFEGKALGVYLAWAMVLVKMFVWNSFTILLAGFSRGGGGQKLS